MQAVGVQSQGVHTRKVIGKWVKVVLAFLLFLFFMAPFLLVVMNSAKTAVEISLSPVAMPANWGQLGDNISNTLGNPHFSYWSAFRDSLIITFSPQHREHISPFAETSPLFSLFCYFSEFLVTLKIT